VPIEYQQTPIEYQQQQGLSKRRKTQQLAEPERQQGSFDLLDRKHTGNKSTAMFFILLNRKHVGNKSTAELNENEKEMKSSKQGRKSNTTKFATQW
jgi:hypothetical protein